ncbi:MAG: hypothetical protein A2Z50_02355 [Nitrospirae bacterium RBG_19FT_COMBO_42_15]|nr:MAG: hypothetical protein A2Z50_02355 [Nitrospirae bacterium RBG_19FT_COMBO_42_15]
MDASIWRVDRIPAQKRCGNDLFEFSKLLWVQFCKLNLQFLIIVVQKYSGSSFKLEPAKKNYPK